MTVLQSILLGVIQGLTEFLPVSSSAHLILGQELFGTEEPDLLFSVLVHLGTLLAVLVAFRNTIRPLFAEALCMGRDLLKGRTDRDRGQSSRRMIFFLLLSLVPLLAIYPLKSFLDPFLVSPLITGICLIFNAFVLILCDLKSTGSKTSLTMTWKDSLFVGIIQCIAILPGLSRSGSTITAGVCRGLDRNYAAEYSFILSIPTILAGAVLELADALNKGVDPGKIPVYLAGMTSAALAGFGAIRLLQHILKSKRFIYFALYSLAVGITAVFWTALH